jgi:hypothetical protein
MLLVVGGHSRKIGKTSVVAGLIEALPQGRWSAVKVTRHAGGVDHAEDQPHIREVQRAAGWVLFEQLSIDSTDSGRYLAAGARRAFWLKAGPAALGDAIVPLLRVLGEGGNVILESNSVLEFLSPDLSLMVLDVSVSDVKASSRRFLERADAFLVSESGSRASMWDELLSGPLARIPRFPATGARAVAADLARFVSLRLGA